MSDRIAFIRAILANREDDAPRLIYADWMEELGEGERAEYIRLACELARLPYCDGECSPRVERSCRACVIRRREKELLYNHGAEWLEGCPVEFPSPFRGDIFRRGFIQSVTLTAEGWLSCHRAVTWHPDCGWECAETAQPLETVRLTTWLDEEAFGEVYHWFVAQGGDTVGTSQGDMIKARWPWLTVELPPERSRPHLTGFPTLGELQSQTGGTTVQ